MIYSLTGKVSVIDENTIVVDTGSMGFEVCCSTYAVYDFSKTHETQTILTYLQVREDAMCLFGFKDKTEKSLFYELSQISGIGPKKAISILSGLPVKDIIKAITTQDVKLLSSIKGLGKKTAEIIVVKLSSKLGGIEGIEGILSSVETLPLMGITKTSKVIDETVDVLVSTGIQKAHALQIAKENYKDGMTSEELVLKCFKNLNK